MWHKIAYKSACMADRPEIFEPTRGFSRWPIQWNHAKCCGPILVAMATKFWQFFAQNSLKSACMADRPEMSGHTRGFLRMAESMEKCKMLWARPLLPWQRNWAGRGVQSPTGLFSCCLLGSFPLQSRVWVLVYSSRSYRTESYRIILGTTHKSCDFLGRIPVRQSEWPPFERYNGQVNWVAERNCVHSNRCQAWVRWSQMSSVGVVGAYCLTWT